MVKRWVQGALTALAAVVLCAATPVASHAIQFQLTNDFCTGGCGTLPAGTVDVVQNGPNVDITVTLLNGNKFVQTGAGDNQAFMFNATGVTLATSPSRQRRRFSPPTLLAMAPRDFRFWDQLSHLRHGEWRVQR